MSCCSHKFELFCKFFLELCIFTAAIAKSNFFFTVSMNITIIKMKFYSWMKRVDHMDCVFFVVLSSFGFDRNYRFLVKRKIAFDDLFSQDIKKQIE